MLKSLRSYRAQLLPKVVECVEGLKVLISSRRRLSIRNSNALTLPKEELRDLFDSRLK